MCVCAQSHDHVWLFASLWTVAHQAPLSMGFLGQETGQSWHFLLHESSQSRDHICISCIGSWFLYCYATWETPINEVAWNQIQNIFEACLYTDHQFSSVQLVSHVWLFLTPWIAACQSSLSITNSRSLLKLMSIKTVMPSNHNTEHRNHIYTYYNLPMCREWPTHII